MTDKQKTLKKYFIGLGWKDKGFNNALKDINVELSSKRVPDLYKIEGDLINIMELEDTNTLSENKLRDYSYLWFSCDTYKIELNLFVIDKYGNMATLPLVDYYYEFLEKDTKKPKEVSC